MFRRETAVGLELGRRGHGADALTNRLQLLLYIFKSKLFEILYLTAQNQNKTLNNTKGAKDQ